MFSVDKAAAVNEKKKKVEIELHLSKAKHSYNLKFWLPISA